MRQNRGQIAWTAARAAVVPFWGYFISWLEEEEVAHHGWERNEKYAGSDAAEESRTRAKIRNGGNDSTASTTVTKIAAMAVRKIATAYRPLRRKDR